VSDVRFPWESEDAPVGAATPLPRGAAPSKPRGRRPRATPVPAIPGGQHRPGWLHHHLTVTGPTDMIAAFTTAARGAGITPWATDSVGVEEYVFNLAASQPPALRRLSIKGCRVLARQYRERFEAHHARAAARVGCSRACPFDLHALLPVPDAILRLGAADASAQAWLAANWGADTLRQVTQRIDAGPGRRLPRSHAVVGYGFFTGGDTPQAAIMTVAARWAGLRFGLRPLPD